MAVKMAAAAWLQVLPVTLFLLGPQLYPLSLFGVGLAPVSAADRSKWHVPIPSVSVKRVPTEPGGARGGATAAQGVHEGSAEGCFRRGGIPGESV